MRPVFQDPALEARFREVGYVALELLTAADVAALHALCARLNPHYDAAFYTTLWSSQLDYRQQVFTGLREILEPRWAPLLADYRYVLGNLAVKRAGDAESRVPLHQDWSFCDESLFTAVGVWVPLVDVDRDNGCLHVVPASHRWCENVRPNGPGDVGSPYAHVYPLIGDEYLHPLPLTAGHMVLYHPRLLHGSPPNRTSLPRIAAVSMTLPREAPLEHYYRRSPEEIEVYQVDDDFYWREVVLEGRPPGREPAGTIDGRLRVFSRDEFLALDPAPLPAAAVPPVFDAEAGR